MEGLISGGYAGQESRLETGGRVLLRKKEVVPDSKCR